MITLLESARWVEGRVDGVIRHVRRPVPDDGLLSGAILRMGDDTAGPVLAMTIEARRFPRQAPVHLHKSDSFRMALGQPIVVGRTSYQHGQFRLQEADRFYGPELWTDEVGTNQLLLVADRRGLRPILTTEDHQHLVDDALATDPSVQGITFLDRDAPVTHALTDNLGSARRAGHWDGGFTGTEAWPALPDGSRLAVIGLGDPESGPLVLGWDRPPAAPALPPFVLGTDLVRLVVEGTCILGGTPLGRLGFRLQQEGTRHHGSEPGPAGSRELWILADRRGWPPHAEGGGDSAGRDVLSSAGHQVDRITAPMRA
jgi:hypothetical protein